MVISHQWWRAAISDTRCVMHISSSDSSRHVYLTNDVITSSPIPRKWFFSSLPQLCLNLAIISCFATVMISCSVSSEGTGLLQRQKRTSCYPLPFMDGFLICLAPRSRQLAHVLQNVLGACRTLQFLSGLTQSDHCITFSFGIGRVPQVRFVETFQICL